MRNFLKVVINPLFKSQLRLYVFFGLLLGLYQLSLFIKYQELKMLGLGLFKGTIIGMGIGLVTGLAIKELCKKKKIKNLNGQNKTDNNAS